VGLTNTSAISVVMPVKNGAAFIPELSKSLNSNLGVYDEVLVIDDHSDDNSLQELNLWAKNNEKVRVLQNKGHGIVEALNFGVSESRNSWIARFDVDDLYTNNRLESQRLFLKPGKVAIFSDYSFFSETQNNLGSIQSGITNNVTKLSLVSGQRTAHSSAIFNKSAFNSAGKYRKEDFPVEDLSLWLRLSRLGEFYSVPKILLNYRIGTNSVTSSKRAESISKKAELLRSIGIENSVVENAINEWSNTLEIYKEFEYETRRKILFLRDMMQICRTKEKSWLELTKIDGLTPNSIINPQSLKAIKDLYLEKRLRSQVRAKLK